MRDPGGDAGRRVGRSFVGKEDGATHARLLHCVLYRFVGDEVSFLALFSGFGLFLFNVRNESHGSRWTGVVRWSESAVITVNVAKNVALVLLSRCIHHTADDPISSRTAEAETSIGRSHSRRL